MNGTIRLDLDKDPLAFTAFFRRIIIGMVWYGVCVCVCVFKCDRYLFYVSYSMGRLGLIQQVKEIVCLIPCRRTSNTPPLNIFM